MRFPRFSTQIIVVTAVILGLVSCTTNRRTAPAAEKAYTSTPTTADLTKGWSLHFCTSQTVDDNVSVEIGRVGDESSHRVWRAFNPRVDPTLLLPEDLRFVDKLWIKLTSENHRQVEACLKFNGNSAKKLVFDESAEESVDRTNSEDCGC